MNKRNIFTAIGLALSFAIAIGGWGLVSRLIDIHDSNLMSAAGVAPIAMPIAVPQPAAAGSPNGLYARPLLTELQMFSVLQHKNAPGRDVPHDPAQGQITMEEAIGTARAWLSFLAYELEISEELFLFEDDAIEARLTQNQHRSGEPLRGPEYSFWTVTMRCPVMAMTATMSINAAEGQVWDTEIFSRRPIAAWAIGTQEPWFRYYRTAPVPPPRDNIAPLSPMQLEVDMENLANVLDAFTSYLGLDTPTPGTGTVVVLVPDSTEENNFGTSVLFADGLAYASVGVRGVAAWTYNREAQWHVSHFHMYLGVHGV